MPKYKFNSQFDCMNVEYEDGRVVDVDVRQISREIDPEQEMSPLKLREEIIKRLETQ